MDAHQAVGELFDYWTKRIDSNLTALPYLNSNQHQSANKASDNIFASLRNSLPLRDPFMIPLRETKEAHAKKA